MRHCPSHDWDHYLALSELSELCPQCGKPNALDEDGEIPVYPEDPAFCSQDCRDRYVADEAEAAKAEAEALEAWIKEEEEEAQ